MRKFVRKSKIQYKMAIGYYLEKRCDKSGDAPIRVSLSIQGARVVTSIGYNINPSKWDVKRQRVKQGCTNSKGATYSTINARISDITAFFMRYESDLKQDNDPITKERLSNVWAQNFKGNKRSTPTAQTLLDLFDKFINEQSKANSWADATVTRFKYIRKQIADYTQNPTFEDFDRSGIIAFANYQQDVRQLRNSTITKNLAFLRWFLRWAVENDYSSNIDFEKYRPKLKSIKSTDKKVIFLTWDEYDSLSISNTSEKRVSTEGARCLLFLLFHFVEVLRCTEPQTL